MGENHWNLKQTFYLKKTAIGYWLGSCLPSFLIYFTLFDKDVDYLHLWYIGLITFTTASCGWRIFAYNLILKNKLSTKSFNQVCFGLTAANLSFWGLLSLAVFPQVTLQEQFFIGIIIAGVSAGSFTINASSLHLAQTTLLGLLLPYIGALLLTAGESNRMMVAACLVYLLVLLKAARVLNQTIKREFTLAARNEFLREELEAKTITLIHQARLASFGEMAGSMAHEVNNPMTTLMTNLDLLTMRLSDRTLDERSIASITERMRSSVERVSLIVKNLAHFSKGVPSPEIALYSSMRPAQSLSASPEDQR